VAAVLLGTERLRYLVCARCATEWYLPRVQCASCGATDRLGSLSLDGPGQAAPPAVRAEACDACRRYVKIIDLERVPDAEPVADDAATLVLDLLVGARGYRRAGPNLLAPASDPGEPHGAGPHRSQEEA
jgi:FdhE protein